MRDFDVEDEQIAAVAQLNSDAVADRFHRIYEWLTIVHCRNLEVVEIAADYYLVTSTDKLQEKMLIYRDTHKKKDC